MSRKCSVCNKGPQYGNRVSHAHNLTRHRWLPNLQNKRIWVPELNRFVRVRVCASVMKTIAKKGAYRVLLDAGLVKPPKPRKKIPAP